MDKIKVGDDVIIGGKVKDIQDGAIFIALKSGVPCIVTMEDIKTYRPAGKGGDAE